jgi:hypothetical protein
VPTQFFHLLVKAGKAIVVVITKMQPRDAPDFVEHFRSEILSRLPKLPGGETPAVPVVALPQLSPEERADPGGAGSKYRVPLLNQILVQCESDATARARTVTNAAKYLSTAGEGLLDVARRDLTELDAWKAAVFAGKAAFEERYRREYLSGEQFRRFDNYRERLTSLLELPGAGQFVGGLFWALRSPYRWTRDYVFGLMVRPDVLNLPEPAVLVSSLTGWLDSLQAEALRKAPSHPLWKQIAVRFESEVGPQARDRFNTELRTFELKESDDLEKAGQALVDGLEKNPVLLYTLRGGKFALDLTVIGTVLFFTWLPSWYHLLLIPLGVSATHQFTELVARGIAEGARTRVRTQRETLVTSSLTAPLATWLAEWPSTGGTSIEKLQLVLRRVPDAIRLMEERVATKVATMTTAPDVQKSQATQPTAPASSEQPS